MNLETLTESLRSHADLHMRRGGAPRGRIARSTTALSTLLAATLMGACAVASGDPGATGTTESAIWANAPGVRQLNQILTWEPVVNAGANSQVAVAAYAQTANGPNVIHTFFFDANQCLQHYYEYEQGDVWYHDSTQYCAGPGAYGPTSVAWDATGRIDIFWFDKSLLGPQTTLMHRWTDGVNWATETLVSQTAVPAISAPTVASWGTGHLDVFWRDQNNTIKWLGFDRSKKGASGYTPGGWFSSERAVSYGATGDPTAVERATNAIDLFWTANTGILQHEYTQNGGVNWSGGQSLNVAAVSTPSATSWGPGRIDMVYAVDTTHVGHMSFDSSSGSWVAASETLASAQNVGTPVAVSAAGRANRIDVFGAPSGTALSHTIFQNSLPGYSVVFQPNAEWCWAATAASVLNYETLRLKGYNPGIQECSLVNLERQRTDCCTINPSDTVNGAPNTSACLIGGDPGPLFSDYGLAYSTSANNLPLPASTLKAWLWNSHQPVLTHHGRKDGTAGHFVVLTDMYELNGQDMVVISDPNSGNYVESYAGYLSNPCGTGTPASCNTVVDYMLYNFHF